MDGIFGWERRVMEGGICRTVGEILLNRSIVFAAVAVIVVVVDDVEL